MLRCLPGRQSEPKDRAVYGYVLFPLGVKAGDHRALAACEAFRTITDDDEKTRMGVKPSKHAMISWLVTDDVPRADIDSAAVSCDTLVGKYNKERGDIIFEALRAQIDGLSHDDGPLLVAWQGPSPMAKGFVLVFDLQMRDTEAEFRNAFAVWREENTEPPSDWQRFRPKQITDTATVWINKLGPTVVAFAKDFLKFGAEKSEKKASATTP